jgi:anti-sigma factor RsiW
VTCRQLDGFLGAYVHGELPDRTRAAFERHLAICPACVAYLQAYRTTIHLAKQLAEDVDGPVPVSVPEELIRAVLAAQHP